MTTIRLPDVRDLRLDDYRQLLDPDLARRRGLFIAEGRLVVARVLADSRFRIRSLLLNDAARRALAPDLASLNDAVPVYVCEAGAFQEITGVNVHRGCLALVERPRPGTLDEVLSGARLVVALDAVANADNVGGVFRNAAAFGVDAVVLSPTTCDPLYRKAIRTSMAAALRVPFARAHGWREALERLRAAGFTVAALTAREPAETLDDFAAEPRPPRLALVLGAEGSGVGPESEALAHRRIRIPTRPEVDSLNLAVAAGIALARLSRLLDAGAAQP
jgi:tRNA G18 (ribose-2'-O)-methylase SpoU